MSTSNSVLANMAVIISAKTAEFNRALQASQASLNKFQTGVANVSNAMGVAFGATTVFSGLSYGVGVLRKFEERMSEVRSITKATDKEFDELRKNAIELGRSTKFTAEQVAELQVAYGRLGFTNKEILQVTKATLELATATGEDLAKSADVAGSTLRAFGLDASEMQKVIDVMAASFNKSALGLENFYEAIKYVAPVAAANNITLEETTALLGTLADNGIRGSMAGTSLRKIISDLEKGTKPLNQKLAELAAKGFNSADAMDEVGRTAYASLLTLVKYTDKTNDLAKALKNASGEAANMALVRADNLTGDIDKFTSAIDVFILKFGEGESSLRTFTQTATKLIDLLSSSKAIRGLAMWASAVTLVPRNTLIGITEVVERTEKAMDKIDKRLASIRAARNKVADELKAEDKRIIEEIWGEKGTDVKPSKNWNPFGSMFEEINKGSKAIQKLVTTLETLKAKQDDLNKQFEQVDTNDRKKLSSLGAEILAIGVKIEALEKLRKKQEELKNYQFLPDLEAEGSLNGDLRNDQAANEAREFTKALEEQTIALNTDNAAFIRLDATMRRFGDASKKVTEDVIEISRELASVIGNSIGTLANDLGQALGGNKEIKFGESILRGLANFAADLGQTLIALGVAAQAAKKLIVNPTTAIAAGVALVAIAGAMHAGLNKAQSNYNSSGSSYSRQASSNYDNYQATGGNVVSVMERGEWRISGRDIVYTYDKNKGMDNGRKIG